MPQVMSAPRGFGLEQSIRIAQALSRLTLKRMCSRHFRQVELSTRLSLWLLQAAQSLCKLLVTRLPAISAGKLSCGISGADMPIRERSKIGDGQTVGTASLDLVVVPAPTNGVFRYIAEAIGYNVANRTQTVIHEAASGGGMSAGAATFQPNTYGSTQKSLALTLATVNVVQSGGALILRVTGPALGITMNWSGKLTIRYI